MTVNIPLNIDWQQILLHLLNFAILAGGLYFLLYAPVKKFMEQRTQHYKDMEAQAEKLRQEAEALKAQREDQLRTLEQELQEKRMAAQEELRRSTEQQRQSAEKAADAVLAEAKKAAERCKAKAMQDSQKELQELAVTIAQKLALEPGDSVIDRFLDAAEKESAHVSKEM